MIERIEEMPAGTIGFRASGKLRRDDYVGALEPAMREAVELVTDVDWIRHAMHMFGWMSPGEVAVYELEREDEARAWITG